MSYIYNGLQFGVVCAILPERDVSKNIKLYFPQDQYINRNSYSLHEYGKGPFCRFRIPNNYAAKQGVYILLSDGEVKYVGECKDLAKRFNIGYGNISPRNCYVGGQPTNCRINNAILQEIKNVREVILLFHETIDRFDIERSLIHTLRPPWNKSTGKKQLSIRNKASYLQRDKQNLIFVNGRKGIGKYQPLGDYLSKSTKDIERLTFVEIETILSAALPASASKYRAWWANDNTHIQSRSWLDFGWEVDHVELGKNVTFRKSN